MVMMFVQVVGPCRFTPREGIGGLSIMFCLFVYLVLEISGLLCGCRCSAFSMRSSSVD
jgi:hypothetical protein